MTRIDLVKEEVVVELLEAAVPIPITVKMDAVKAIRRDEEPSKNKEKKDSRAITNVAEESPDEGVEKDEY